MQIRFIKKWKAYIKGDHTIVKDKIGQPLIDKGIAIDESDQYKAIDKPSKDKMIRSTKRK
jgi:hypothetical protein